jgi:site-specific DNA-methyltransferase (adenine-specific)
MKNKLYFGDNLDVLRKHVKDESVDLIYLDPPFNSNATYNVLFKERGSPSEAQAEAFRDTWGWGEAAAIAYDEVLQQGTPVSGLIAAFRSWLGDSSMMAYLAMMTVRLVELQRALKPTGSLYLHCDPTASHYLKLILDGLFGHENFQNEIIWKRTSAHSSAKRYGPVHDTILFYSASRNFTWNPIYGEYDQQYIDAFYTHKDDDGAVWRRSDLTGAGVRRGDTGLPWRGIDITAKGRHWAYVPDTLEAMDKAGKIHWPQKAGGMPMLKRYLAEQRGVPLQDIWSDIRPIHNMATDRLGYPTQKPINLLERIIEASSNPDGVVLDPFCGCGTSVEAAQRLGRQWIGIDVTHYAVTLIQKRLLRYPAASYEVFGRPTDLAGARDLARRDKHQFQWWAAWVLGAQTYESKRGADRGIDANLYFANGPYGHGRIIVSVKGGDNVSPVMVRELSGVVQREPDATMGILITLADPTKAMLSDAAGAGFVEKSAHGRLPRVQIVTIADLLDGRFPKMPPLPQPVNARPRRKAAKDRDQLELLLPISTNNVITENGATVDPRYLKIA